MSTPILVETLRALVDRRDLTRTEAAAAMEAIMSGAATPAQIGAFLTALRMKGETVEELIGFAQVMRAKAVRVRTRGEAIAALTEPLARVLAELGTLRAFVVHGADGLDEISTTGESLVAEVREGVVRRYTVRPEDFGVPRASIAELRGGDREQNALIIRRILEGEPGPRRDIVLVNAAAALVAGRRADDLKDGVAVAAESIDSGRGLATLERLTALSRQIAAAG